MIELPSCPICAYRLVEGFFGGVVAWCCEACSLPFADTLDPLEGDDE